MNRDVFEKALELSEAFFGTKKDPEQIPVTQASADKLQSIHPNTIRYQLDERGDPIAWVVVIPTSTETMQKFTSGSISERELLDVAAEERSFEALYLCSAFVLPEYRRKGYAKQLLLDGIRELSGGRDLPLYAWVYSEAGERLVDAVSQTLGRQVARRESV